MDFRRFVDEHRTQWKRLEVLLARIDDHGLRRLSSEDTREFAQLYRKASADLLLARDEAGDTDVADYLSAIVGRAYAVIHQPRRYRRDALIRFARSGFPALFRREKGYVGAAAATLLLGFLTAFILTSARPEVAQREHRAIPRALLFASCGARRLRLGSRPTVEDRPIVQ